MALTQDDFEKMAKAPAQTVIDGNSTTARQADDVKKLLQLGQNAAAADAAVPSIRQFKTRPPGSV